jgi:DnaJ domain
MQLPTRLERTTLGDLLGSLFRERLTGVLELIDERGAVHRVGLELGQVCSVETPWGPRLGDLVIRRHGEQMAFAVERQLWQGGTQRLGEGLVARGALTHPALARLLEEQSRERLEALFGLQSARVVFRPARSDRELTPISAAEYLPGRARRRGQEPATRFTTPQDDRSEEWAVLGVEPGATPAEVRAAFRRRALELHPDSNLHRTPSERARSTAQFLRLSAAYRKLVA